MEYESFVGSTFLHLKFGFIAKLDFSILVHFRQSVLCAIMADNNYEAMKMEHICGIKVISQNILTPNDI